MILCLRTSVPLSRAVNCFDLMLGPLSVTRALQMEEANESDHSGMARMLGMFCLKATLCSLLVGACVLLK